MISIMATKIVITLSKTQFKRRETCTIVEFHKSPDSIQNLAKLVLGYDSEKIGTLESCATPEATLIYNMFFLVL